jgi:hypothetical protein
MPVAQCATCPFMIHHYLLCRVSFRNRHVFADAQREQCLHNEIPIRREQTIFSYFLFKRKHRMHRSLKQEAHGNGHYLGQGGNRGACSGSRPDRSIISRAMLLWVATESARNRAFRHKERGAPVRSAWRSAMRQIWCDAMSYRPPNVS